MTSEQNPQSPASWRPVRRPTNYLRKRHLTVGTSPILDETKYYTDGTKAYVSRASSLKTRRAANQNRQKVGRILTADGSTATKFLQKLSNSVQEKSYVFWYRFRLIFTVCDLVLLAIAVDDIREQVNVAPHSHSPSTCHAKLVDDLLVLIDLSFVSMKAYYMRMQRIRDNWIMMEIAVTWFAFVFQAAYWPAAYLMGSAFALKVLAWASFRAFRCCAYLKRMREILSALMHSYKEIAIAFLLLLVGLAVITTVCLCFFEPKPDGHFRGFASTYMTTFQLFSIHQTRFIISRSSASDSFRYAQMLIILSWIFMGGVILRHVITAIMVGSFVENRDNYERMMKQKTAFERNRRAQKRLKEIFPLFYAHSVQWANRDPQFMTIPQLIESSQQLFHEFEVWKKTWFAAIKYIHDPVEETIWPLQPLVYYETALSCMQNILSEDKFLIQLAQEIGLRAITERLSSEDPLLLSDFLLNELEEELDEAQDELIRFSRSFETR